MATLYCLGCIYIRYLVKKKQFNPQSKTAFCCKRFSCKRWSETTLVLLLPSRFCMSLDHTHKDLAAVIPSQRFTWAELHAVSSWGKFQKGSTFWLRAMLLCFTWERKRRKEKLQGWVRVSRHTRH